MNFSHTIKNMKYDNYYLSVTEIYQDVNFVLLNLELCYQEEQSKHEKKIYAEKFLDNLAKNHYRLIDAVFDLMLVNEYFDIHRVIERIKNFGSYERFDKQVGTIRFVKRVLNMMANIFPNEVPIIGTYDESGEILTFDRFVYNVLKKYEKWDNVLLRYSFVYDYFLREKYAIPEDYDLGEPPIASILYMYEHDMTEYPRTVLTNKYAKYCKTQKKFMMFDNYKQSNSKEGMHLYAYKRGVTRKENRKEELKKPREVPEQTKTVDINLPYYQYDDPYWCPEFVLLNLDYAYGETLEGDIVYKNNFITKNHHRLMESIYELYLDNNYFKVSEYINRLKQFNRFDECKETRLKSVDHAITIRLVRDNVWPQDMPIIGTYGDDGEIIDFERYVKEILRNNQNIRTIEVYYKDVYDYLLKEKYPLPNDYEFGVLSSWAYLYMLENNMTDYPRTIITNNYADYNSGKFRVFDNDEQRKSEDGKKYFVEKLEKTYMERYGVKNPTLVPEIRRKQEETNLERYGTIHPSQNEEIKEKTRQTNRERYGYDYSLQLPEIKKKIEETNLERYGNKCSLQNDEVKRKADETNLLKYGSTHVLDNPEVRQRMIERNREKYGCDWPGQNPEIMAKTNATNQERYGVDFPLQNEEIYLKTIETIKERYGCDNVFELPEIREKIRETMFERYGVEYPCQCEEIMEKLRQTNLERYGVEISSKNPNVVERGRLTNQERRGVDFTLQDPEVQEKAKETMIERYGVEHAAQNPEIMEQIKQTNLERYGSEFIMQTNEFQEKSKETCMKKYGFPYAVQNPEISDKIYKTKKENGTLNTSKEELDILSMLVSLFGSQHVHHNYNKDSRYPYRCDFYIDYFDMFIEYQGTWGHCDHPYDPNSEEDNLWVEHWKERSNVHNSYNSAIKTWTIRDPEKRRVAKENNLLYVELWNMTEALEFMDLLPLLTSL